MAQTAYTPVCELCWCAFVAPCSVAMRFVHSFVVVAVFVLLAFAQTSASTLRCFRFGCEWMNLTTSKMFRVRTAHTDKTTIQCIVVLCRLIGL